MDKIKSLKVKQADGTLGAAIALGADAINIDLANGSNVEAAISALQNNQFFEMKHTTINPGSHRITFLNQDIIDLMNFCEEHKGERDFSNMEEAMMGKYPPYHVMCSVQSELGVYLGTMLSVYRLDMDNMPVLYIAGHTMIGNVSGGASSPNCNAHFVDMVLVLNVTAEITNNPTVTSTFVTTNTYDNLQGYIDYITLARSANVYTKTEINDLIGNLSSLNIEVVTALPTANISSSTIYLVARENGDVQNVYEEYIYVNNKWEMIGTTEIDTSSFDEVHVGSDTPTADSVEIWIDPNGEASEGNADAYTKTETDAKIAEAMYNVNNIIKLDSSLDSTTLKPILKHIVDTIEENEKEAPLVIVINSNNSLSKHVVYGYSNKYTDGAYTNYKFNGTTEVGYSSETAKGSYVKRSEYYLTIMYNPSTDTYSFTAGRSTYNSDTFLPTGNQNVSGFTPTYAYHPATKKYVDEYSYSKAEIDAKFTALASQYVKQVNGTTTALWMGTKAQYDAIAKKDATTTYIIQGEE